MHGVLRPFLLRRLKRDVEKQLPGKHEHVVHCRLSKRQRALYEDYMASSDTTSKLSSGNFLGIINVLMQLRKARPALCPRIAPHRRSPRARNHLQRCLCGDVSVTDTSAPHVNGSTLAGVQPPGPFRGASDCVRLRHVGFGPEAAFGGAAPHGGRPLGSCFQSAGSPRSWLPAHCARAKRAVGYQGSEGTFAAATHNLCSCPLSLSPHGSARRPSFHRETDVLGDT